MKVNVKDFVPNEVSDGWSMCLSFRQPVNPRARQQPQQEASPQEPEEPEEILGSDDEEQEDPNDYCKGES